MHFFGVWADACQRSAGNEISAFQNFSGNDILQKLLATNVDFVCVPDNRQFEACRDVLQASKHLLVEKPSVLSVGELDELVAMARKQRSIAYCWNLPGKRSCNIPSVA